MLAGADAAEVFVGRREVHVAELPLDVRQRNPPPEQVADVAVPQPVRVDPLLDPGSLRQALQRDLHIAGGLAALSA